MKLNIAPKLFLGFLGIIVLNLSFVVIVGGLSDLNTITKILKEQNEIKNHLLRISNLHVNQARSRYIYKELGKDDASKNFIETGKKTMALVDTVMNKLHHVIFLDSLISEDKKCSVELRKLLNLVSRDIQKSNNQFNSSFNQLLSLKLKPNSPQKLKHIKFLNEVLDSSDQKLRSGLVATDSLIDIRTMIRIKTIENKVSKVKRVTLIIVTGISILAILFGIFFSKAITNSLRRLKVSATNIGKGEFDFDPKGYPNDEIGELATAFFDMALDLKNTQDELVRSKRLAAIGEIVASVNHEINNPLMIISGNAQFLEMSMDDCPQEMKERVKTILEETDRISMVTKKLREIKKTVTEDYTSSGEQMINLDKSTTA